MRRDDRPSNFPGLKDPDRQSRFGQLADRDVTLGHAREWSRQRMMTARQLADQIEAIKQSQRRDVAAASEWDGSPGRSKGDSLREDLEKALIKPQLLAASAPLVTVIPSTALGKVAAGGVGAALGGIGGEDPYFSALSMLHPVAAMGQMANAMYSDKPLVPVSEAEANKLRLFSGLSTPNKLNRAFHASTDPAYASKRAMQMSKPDDPMFVHTPKVDDSKLVQFSKTYDTRRAPEAFTNFPRSESISGEDVYEALRPYADEHADDIVRGMGYVGFERPNTGSFGNGRWFRISDPDGVEQSFAGGGSVGGGLNLLKKALTGQLGLEAGTAKVIKGKGGNWLTGSVEGALYGVKKDTRLDNDDYRVLAGQLGRQPVEEDLAGLKYPDPRFAHGGTIDTTNLTVGRLRDIIASLNQEQTDA